MPVGHQVFDIAIRGESAGSAHDAGAWIGEAVRVVVG